MKQALRLARRGAGRTAPNPSVGAVIVREERSAQRVVGEGFHKKAGGAHAEITALEEARESAKGAVLYITLEPCSHHGKTPPCTDAIIKAGISKVIVAMLDPNPIVNGQGIARLKEAGISVTLGVCEEEARELNEGFIKLIATGLPFVSLKWAMTLDGKIATTKGDSKWISGNKARRFVHELRNSYDAVMVGIKTVLKDNPELTCRIRGGRNPRRIILDPDGVIPVDVNLVAPPISAPTLIVSCKEFPHETVKILEERGVEFLMVSSKAGRPDILPIMQYLGRTGVASVLVEGGGGVNAWMLEDGVADKVYAFIAAKIVGGKEAVTPVEGIGVSEVNNALVLHNTEWQKIGEDMLVKGYIK